MLYDLHITCYTYVQQFWLQLAIQSCFKEETSVVSPLFDFGRWLSTVFCQGSEHWHPCLLWNWSVSIGSFVRFMTNPLAMCEAGPVVQAFSCMFTSMQHGAKQHRCLNGSCTVQLDNCIVNKLTTEERFYQSSGFCWSKSGCKRFQVVDHFFAASCADQQATGDFVGALPTGLSLRGQNCEL